MAGAIPRIVGDWIELPEWYYERADLEVRPFCFIYTLLPSRIDSISGSISSALALSCSRVSSAMGCSVRTMGYLDAPHISAIERAVISNMSVQMVTDGVPAFSAWIPSCTLHALQDPQLPIATTM